MKYFLTGTILMFLLKAMTANALELTDLSKAASDASREINDTESSLKIVTELPRGPKVLADKKERPEQAIVDVIEDESKTVAKGK